MDKKKLKYQLRYFVRDVSRNDVLVKYESNGDIEIKQKIKLFTYTHAFFLFLGIGGLIFNYQKSYDDLVYWLSGAFLMISLLSIVSGYFKNKNAFFKFSPENQLITYSNSTRTDSNAFKTTRVNSWWCEIHTYGKGKSGSITYSAIFYHQNKLNSERKRVALNIHSDYRNDCIRVGKAVNRYLKETTELSNIQLIEK